MREKLKYNEGWGEREELTMRQIERFKKKKKNIPALAHYDQACAIGENFYIFGGNREENNEYVSLNDMYYLHTPTLRWTRVSSPLSPEPRTGHQLVATLDRIYLFGGGDW